MDRPRFIHMGAPLVACCKTLENPPAPVGYPQLLRTRLKISRVAGKRCRHGTVSPALCVRLPMFSAIGATQRDAAVFDPPFSRPARKHNLMLCCDPRITPCGRKRTEPRPALGGSRRGTVNAHQRFWACYWKTSGCYFLLTKHCETKKSPTRRRPPAPQVSPGPASAKHQTTTWSCCNECLRQAGSLWLWFDPMMIWVPLPGGKRGPQQKFSAAAIQFCLEWKD